MPERTCVGCRARAPKSELLRVSRPTGGRAVVDPSGVSPGRGAYVHPDPGCLRSALRGGAMPRALRSGLGPEELGSLGTELQAAANARPHPSDQPTNADGSASA